MDCVSYEEACNYSTTLHQRRLQERYEVTVSADLGKAAIDEVYYGVTAIAWKLGEHSNESSAETFRNVFDPVTVTLDKQWKYCGSSSSTNFGCSDGKYIKTRTVVHEIGHMYDKRHKTTTRLSNGLNTVDAILADDGTLVAGKACDTCDYTRTKLGYTNTKYPGLAHGTEWSDFNHSYTEDFADMFLNWIYEDNYDNSGYGQLRSQWMDNLMVSDSVWTQP